MIFDKEVMFADDLDVAGTPTDVDLGKSRSGWGEPLRISVSVDKSVTGMTGLSLLDSEDGSSFEALFTWTGQLAGETQEFMVPGDCRQYLRLNLAGSVTGGNWTAGIVLAPGSQSNH